MRCVVHFGWRFFVGTTNMIPFKLTEHSIFPLFFAALLLLLLPFRASSAVTLLELSFLSGIVASIQADPYYSRTCAIEM